MMKDFSQIGLKLGFISMGKDGFDVALGTELAMRGLERLRGLVDTVVVPEKVVLTNDDETLASINTFRQENIDALVVHCGTFSSAGFTLDIVRRINVPVIVWSVREPGFSGQLRLNSLVCGNAITSSLHKMGHRFKFFYGDADDAQFMEGIGRYLRVLATAQNLRNARIGLIGARPSGFQNVTVDELSLMERIGPEVYYVSTAEILHRAGSIDEVAALQAMESLWSKAQTIDVGQSELLKMARLYSAFKSAVEEYKLDSLAIRCLPEIAAMYGIAPCAAMSFLTNEGIIAACEADILGAVTMMVQRMLLGGTPPFLADMIAVEEATNEGILWHCGVAPVSLANPESVRLSHHYTRKKGVTVEFSLKPGRITLARLTNFGTNYRILIATGESTGEDIPMKGTLLRVKFDQDVNKLLDTIIYRGVEHHFSIAYGDIQQDLVDFGRLLDIEILG